MQIIFTTKTLLFMLSALVRLRAKRGTIHHGILTMSGGRVSVALPGGALGPAVAWADGEEQGTTPGGVYALSDGWYAAAELLRKSKHLTTALMVNESGVVTLEGLEFAAPVVGDLTTARATVAEYDERLTVARRARGGTRDAVASAHEAWAAYGVTVYGARGWAGRNLRGARALTTPEAERAAQLENALNAARGADQAATGAGTDAERALAPHSAHLAALKAADAGRACLSAALNVTPGVTLAVPDLRGVVGAVGVSDQWCYVWADGDAVRASDGFVIRSATPEQAPPAGAAWGGAALKTLGMVAGARGVVELRPGGWAGVTTRAAGVMVSTTPGGVACERPNFARGMNAAAPVLGRFEVIPTEGKRVASLARLFDRACVTDDGLYFRHDDGHHGRETWRGQYTITGTADIPPSVVHVFADAGLDLLALGGAFELVAGPGGVARLRRVECGSVAAGQAFNADEWAGVFAAYPDEQGAAVDVADPAPTPDAPPVEPDAPSVTPERPTMPPGAGWALAAQPANEYAADPSAQPSRAGWVPAFLGILAGVADRRRVVRVALPPEPLPTPPRPRPLPTRPRGRGPTAPALRRSWIVPTGPRGAGPSDPVTPDRMPGRPGRSVPARARGRGVPASVLRVAWGTSTGPQIPGHPPDRAACAPTGEAVVVRAGRWQGVVQLQAGAVTVTTGGAVYRAQADPRGVLHGVSGWGWTDGAALLAVRAAVLDLRRHAA